MTGMGVGGGWRRFVAIGDSFTEGMDDPYPDGRHFRGWADLVAGHLAQQAAARGEEFGYANLAVRGRLFDNIVDEQVPVAMRMDPDLVSFAAGGNDALRRNFDPDRLVKRFDQVIKMLRASGADVLLFRYADLSAHIPGGRRMILPRTKILNQAVGEVAERHGAYLVDLFADPAYGNSRLWSVDRLHMSEAGHRRTAGHVLSALGLEPDPAWMARPADPDRLSFSAALAHDARWVRAHLAPWIKRRLTGRSSGDSITAKRPSLGPVVD